MQNNIELGVKRPPQIRAVILAFALVLFSVYLYFEHHSRVVFLVLCLCLSALLFVSFIERNKDRFVVAWMKSDLSSFIVALLSLGMLAFFIFTPGTVPDEAYHFNSAYKYSNLLLGIETPDYELLMRNDDIAFQNEVMGSRLDRSSYIRIKDNFSLFANDTNYDSFSVPSTYSMASNTPQQRIPAALGIVFAKLLGLGSIPLFYLGRFFNFLFGSCLITIAVCITPIGKNAFKAVALLPMTLHVLASYSYDVASIGFSFILISLFLRCINTEDSIGAFEVIWILVISALLAPCKTIYIFLSFGIFALPNRLFKTRKTALVLKMSVITAAVISLLFAKSIPNLFPSTDAVHTTPVLPSLDRRGEEVGVFYNVGDLVAHPLSTIQLFLRTIDVFGGSWISEMTGMSLGWFQKEIVAPGFLVFLYFGVLLYTVLPNPDDGIVLSKWSRGVFLAIIALISTAVIAALATIFTFNTETIVHGVQGRYFLQFLPLMLICMRTDSVVNRKSYDVTNMMLILNSFYFLRTVAIALSI